MYGRVLRSTSSLVLALAAALPGCGGPDPKAPTVLHPVDEPQAVAIMAGVFRELGIEPVKNRTITVGEQRVPLRLDVASRDRLYGIAYITSQDAEKLGDALPKRRDPDAIIIIQGSGSDAAAHAALLFDADYMQDDLSGESHSASGVAARQRLALATRDFLRRAQHEQWP